MSKGSFGTIKTFTPDKKKVIKESSAIFIVDSLTNKKSLEIVDQIYNLLDDVEMEPQNMFKFSELNSLFPNNILKIYSHSRSKSFQYYQDNYIMDRIYGTDLTDYPIDHSNDLCFEGNVISLFIQSIYVMAYSNINGYFHNDLKGNNLMVSSESIQALRYKELILGEYRILIDIFGKHINIIKVVDYGNSKNIKKKNLVPIEISTLCSVFKLCFKDYVSDEIYNLFNIFDVYIQEACDCGITTWMRNNVSLSTIDMYESLEKLNEYTTNILLQCFKFMKQYIEKSNKTLQPYISIKIEHV